MDELLRSGAEVVLSLQELSPSLDGVFRAITLLGDEKSFMLILPLLFWCLDKRLGMRLAVVFLCATYVNNSLKDVFQLPRPFQCDRRVRQLSDASGYGLPSGHTAGTAVLWGYLATQLRKGWMWALAVVLTVLVGLSRVYLGVHFPFSIVGGLAVAAVSIALYLWLQPVATRWLADRSLGWQIGLAVAVPLILLLIHATKDTVTNTAALMGMGAGYAVERRYVGFKSGGAIWRRAVRFVFGAIVVFVLYLGLAEVFPAGLAFRAVRYGLIGLWAGLGAP
jgi:membrane-associated phospholipid phosphatase